MRINEGQFLELLDKWLDYYEIHEISINRDNRVSCLASVAYDELNCEYILRYNWKELRGCKKHTMLSVILHEIGHIFHPGKYETDKQKIKSEYLAEKFALEELKHHHPVHYRNEVKRMRNLLKKKSYRDSLPEIYREAFMKIEDYKS